MKKINVGINGFGRIGKMVLRAICEQPEFKDFNVKAINDLSSAEFRMYVFKNDSVHGGFKGDIKLSEDKSSMSVMGNEIKLISERSPKDIYWSDYGVDIVIDCTGLFLTKESCLQHIESSPNVKVVMSAPPKDDTPIFVYGVNHDKLNSELNVVSAASCTTNALAPIVKVLQDSVGIKKGLMTTVHAATASQSVVDGFGGKDWRGGRSVLGNIIPSSTGAALAVGKVIPEVAGILTGMAVRVPSADVSLVDLTVETIGESSLEKIKELILIASQTNLKNVLQSTDEQVVSSDLIGNASACIFDETASIELDKNFFKLIAWYDNEYGYTCNLLRLVKELSKY